MRDLPFEVFSYSSEDDLPEQVASIRSFLKFAGRPLRFTVVSDGTHSVRSLALLEAIDPVVSTRPSSAELPRELPTAARAYLTSHPTGKQLALIMSLPEGNPTLYVDADVLFFPGAHELSLLVPQSKAAALYLEDCQLSADERLFRKESEKERPVNTGVLFLFKPLDWSLGLARLEELSGPPNFFTNQTLTHLTIHESSAAPFDPQKYVLQLDDQFVFCDRYASQEIVLRHYVNPVRHKFWANL